MSGSWNEPEIQVESYANACLIPNPPDPVCAIRTLKELGNPVFLGEIMRSPFKVPPPGIPPVNPTDPITDTVLDPVKFAVDDV